MSGALYVHALDAYLEQSSLALAGQVPQSVDVGRFLIRPLFVRFGIAVLLTLPLVVWQASARLDTQDDLRSSWSRAATVFLGMLLVTTADVGLLFAYGRLPWAPVLIGFVGLGLVGLAFISVGLLIAAVVVRRVPRLIVLQAVGVALAASAWSSSPASSALRAVSVARHLDDFAKGVLDSGHLFLYVSLIVCGLVLTARALESPAQT